MNFIKKNFDRKFFQLLFRYLIDLHLGSTDENCRKTMETKNDAVLSREQRSISKREQLEADSATV